MSIIDQRIHEGPRDVLVEPRVVKDEICRCQHSKKLHMDAHPRYIGYQHADMCAMAFADDPCTCPAYHFDHFVFSD